MGKAQYGSERHVFIRGASPSLGPANANKKLNVHNKHNRKMQIITSPHIRSVVKLSSTNVGQCTSSIMGLLTNILLFVLTFYFDIIPVKM